MLDNKEFLKPLLENPCVSGVVHTVEYVPERQKMSKKDMPEDGVYVYGSYAVHFSARDSENFTKLIETLNSMGVSWTLADEYTINFVGPSGE